MTLALHVRAAEPQDAAAMAHVHVATWRETYRGLMRDELLDHPGFEASRTRFWTAAMTEARYERNRIAVAENGSELIGIAMAGPPMDEDADNSWAAQLYVLYVYAQHHGAGAGAALLDAVIAPQESAVLWVADPNPRAQAFYRKHGFAPDGTTKVDDGVSEIRMVRGASRPQESDFPGGSGRRIGEMAAASNVAVGHFRPERSRKESAW